MDCVRLSEDRLQDLVDRFAKARIAVVGDFFLDKYLEVDPTLAELSLETGKCAHQVVGIRCSPGAAGTVVCNLAALGCQHLHAIGFSGDDGEGYDLRKQLASLGCRTDQLHLVADRHTPTYLKPRDADLRSLEGEHSRYDTKNRTATAAALQQQVVQALDTLLPQLDAVIVLDQVEQPECGVVTARVRQAIAERAPHWPRVIFWADSRRRIREFSHVIIKPNQFEAVQIENPRPGDEVEIDALRRALQQLRDKTSAPVVVTRGARGMLVSDPELALVPGVQVNGPIDPTGAGDSATAATVLALSAGAELDQAALVGNLVASITVQQIGTTGVARPEQLLPRLQLWHRQQSNLRCGSPE